MKRIFILLSMAVVCITAIAARYNYTFKDTPVAQALAILVKDNPEAKITFIYNEMDDYIFSLIFCRPIRTSSPE